MDEDCKNSAGLGGAFNASENGVATLQQCAQLSRDRCGDKPVYVSFAAADPVGTTAQQRSGGCLWYGPGQCSCKTAESGCPGEKSFQSAEVSELLKSPVQSSESIPVARSANDTTGAVADVANDPNYIRLMSEEAANALPPPIDGGPVTIASAQELDEKSLRESSENVLQEAVKVGHVAQGCPTNKQAIMHRGEWQCMQLGEGASSLFGGIIGGGIAIFIMAAVLLNSYGARVRSKGGDESEGEGEGEGGADADGDED